MVSDRLLGRELVNARSGFYGFMVRINESFVVHFYAVGCAVSIDAVLREEPVAPMCGTVRYRKATTELLCEYYSMFLSQNI